MSCNGPRYPDEEFARRGKAIYANIKQLVDEGNHGKILAIDIETGEYEIDESDMMAVDRLFAQLTDPQVFCLRIGHRGVLRFNGPSIKKAS